MRLTSRPGVRFLIEAVVIVLTAVVTGLMHLDAWGIAAAVFFVWILAAVVEYSVSHRPVQAVAQEPEPVALPVPPPREESVRVLTP